MRFSAIAAAIGALTLTFACAASADDRTIAEKWDEVERNAAIFRGAAERLGLTGSWTRAAPIRLDFDPPATPDQIRRAERDLGKRLPDSLRSFFTEATAGVHILWLLPGEIETLPGGSTTVRYRRLPPPPWQRPSGTNGHRQPVINGGVLSFSIDSLAGLSARARMWNRLFRREAATAGDVSHATHLQRYADFWDRSLPLSSEGSGGILAVDLEDPEGRLLYLRHEGDDIPGWFLDQTPIDFMVTQSRLGFPGIGESELLAIGDADAPLSATAAAYAEEHGEEAEKHGLVMPRSLRIGTDAPGIDIWRAWLGL